MFIFGKHVNNRFEGGLGWDVKDIWQVVASKLDGSDILKLAATSQWFWETSMDGTVWKRAILCRLGMVVAPETITDDVAFPWSTLYAINFGIFVVVL